jgi:hypothetical protein
VVELRSDAVLVILGASVNFEVGEDVRDAEVAVGVAELAEADVDVAEKPTVLTTTMFEVSTMVETPMLVDWMTVV